MTNFEIRKTGNREEVVVMMPTWELVRFLEKEKVDHLIKEDGCELIIEISHGGDGENTIRWIRDNAWAYE